MREAMPTMKECFQKALRSKLTRPGLAGKTLSTEADSTRLRMVLNPRITMAELTDEMVRGMP